jgi:hypothetical protein
MDIEEEEEIQPKGLNNIFNYTVAENFPKLLKKGTSRNRSIQNTKQEGSEKKHPQKCHN